jgi:fructose-1,6-bisphosphatase-3
MTDVHGEYEAFSHVLRNASGVLRQKLEDNFENTFSKQEQKSLAALIYYPERKIEALKIQNIIDDDWYKITLYRLILVCRLVSSKYTRSKVRKALPKDFAYIIEELLHEEEHAVNKKEYYNEIIHTIITIDRADEFIIEISHLIQRLAVDHLHLLGDIYDRGPGAHKIMDELIKYHSVDIQWGNHDVLWMGAAAGSDVCIANVLRIALRYANLETIEDGYGINLLPLARFAMNYYGEDPCSAFRPKICQESTFRDADDEIIAQMHKAIAIIQFKLEGQLVERHPEYNMLDRQMLKRIDYNKFEIDINGEKYKINDQNFPTVDIKNPLKLIDEEIDLINRLRASFMNSEKMQKHTRLLYAKGSMYLVYNENLMYHACIPVNEEGDYQKIIN